MLVYKNLIIKQNVKISSICTKARIIKIFQRIFKGV